MTFKEAIDDRWPVEKNGWRKQDEFNHKKRNDAKWGYEFAKQELGWQPIEGLEKSLVQTEFINEHFKILHHLGGGGIVFAQIVKRELNEYCFLYRDYSGKYTHFCKRTPEPPDISGAYSHTKVGK